MTLQDLLSPSHIILNKSPCDKQELFHQLADKMAVEGYIENQDSNVFIRGLNEREALSTTGIGDGIAIPHVKSKLISKPVILFLRSDSGIPWDSLDDEPVYLVFMIAVPENAEADHLNILTRLCRWLMDDDLRLALMQAQNEKEIVILLKNKDAEEDDKKSTVEDTLPNCFIVAVTACPTGIAHTYMVAENLEKAAVKLGYQIKVETNGSVGVENALTAEDIQRAEAVIVAADTKVNIDRFAGKPLCYTSVSRGIKEPEILIKTALSAPCYQPDEQDKTGNAPSATPGVYASLMNGVSNMLPFVVAGGILIAISFFWGINSANPDDPSYNYFAKILSSVGGAAFTLFIPVMSGYIAYAISDRPAFAPGMVGGFLANTGGSGFLGAILAGFIAGYTIKLLRHGLRGLPKSFEGIKPILLYPLLSVFIVGFITVAVVGPVMGYINTGVVHFLNDIGSANKILLGFVIGAMLAADLGGPINKAAYLFSVGVLASGNYYVMAAAVASGMVPSLAVALAATLSRDKFTQSQCEAAKANYILGLSFIAEGAIPFAASNPLVILPSLMVGSGIAGSLAMLFNTTYPAPHGGVFVLPVVGNPILFLLSTLIGVIISTALILIFKKKLTNEERIK
ncbi:PTS fructose transporter subunit IIABC [Escherichia albertii]|uniref:PTS fructose transporter subunit IIABC n=1 Tax=Escherichia albertii TaxID=208962 RepID=UPI000DE4CFAD|nr:fructose-specific PTS transporter subunit EIIC [Escherichia albertii]